jgi:hypothetical protein
MTRRFQEILSALSISPPLVRHTSRAKEEQFREADMTKQHNTSESLKSIAGGVLVGLGLHILSGNLAGDATQLRHLLDIPAGEALGVLPSVTLATSQAVQAYGLDHQRFLDGLLQALASFWPLLLVLVGAILLRDALTDRVNELPAPDKRFQNKYFQNKDAGCRFQCPSFDA